MRRCTRRRNRLRPFVWGGAACLLLLPALAMRLRPQSGVDWSALDFAVMGVLLAAVCGLYEFGARRDGSPAYRAGFGTAATRFEKALETYDFQGALGALDGLSESLAGKAQ